MSDIFSEKFKSIVSATKKGSKCGIRRVRT